MNTVVARTFYLVHPDFSKCCGSWGLYISLMIWLTKWYAWVYWFSHMLCLWHYKGWNYCSHPLFRSVIICSAYRDKCLMICSNNAPVTLYVVCPAVRGFTRWQNRFQGYHIPSDIWCFHSHYWWCNLWL